MTDPNQQAVLAAIARGGRSPAGLEANPPDGLTACDVRIAIERLLDAGRVEFNRSLRLVCRLVP